MPNLCVLGLGVHALLDLGVQGAAGHRRQHRRPVVAVIGQPVGVLVGRVPILVDANDLAQLPSHNHVHRRVGHHDVQGTAASERREDP